MCHLLNVAGVRELTHHYGEILLNSLISYNTAVRGFKFSFRYQQENRLCVDSYSERGENANNKSAVPNSSSNFHSNCSLACHVRRSISELRVSDSIQSPGQSRIVYFICTREITGGY